MTKYLMKRLWQTIVVILLVAVATFFMVNLIPGDLVYIVAATDQVDQELYDYIYQSLNLDKGVVERFFLWAWDALHLDFGKSYVYNMPVWDLISSRLPTTIYLSVLTMIVSVPLGVVFGMISGVNRKKKIDTVITLSANTINSLPQFWIGIILMYVLSLKLRLLPTRGFDWPWNIGFGEHIKNLIMPAICLSLGGIAGFTRQTRSSMLEVIRQDFIRTARSKGLPEKKVLFKHMLRNGLIPIVTILGNRLAFIIGGSMFVENIFSIPGMGSLAVRCIQGKDIPTIQAVVLLTTLVLCVAYIITDILYVVVDPRISLTASAD